MSFFGRFRSGDRQDSASAASQADAVERFCAALQNSTLLEDRRTAAQSLKNLAKQHKLEVGTKGMSALIHALKHDYEDDDMARVVVETLSDLCSVSEPSTNLSQSIENLGPQFAEIFVKDVENITILVRLLEDAGFYLRYAIIHFISSLNTHHADGLQEALLTSPAGISKIVDLLDDKREIIRNDGLLLLSALARSNAEIQKIAAFENAFERLLEIIFEEGACDGGIVVADCLSLMHILLRYNSSNLACSCFPRLQYLFSKPSTEPSSGNASAVANEWSPQKTENTRLALETVRIMLNRDNPNVASIQTAATQYRLLQPILELALSSSVPSAVVAQALNVVGDAIYRHDKNQDLFSRQISVVSRDEDGGKPTSAIFAIISMALDASNSFSQRISAAYTLECFLSHNQDAQLALASTFTPPPTENHEEDEQVAASASAGSIIISALLETTASRRDPYRSWLASILLRHILADNVNCKRIALDHQLSDDEIAYLLPTIMMYLMTGSRDAGNVRMTVGYLTLLATWLQDFPQGVSRLLSEGPHIQYLIEQINQASGIDPVVQGVAAYVFAQCILFNDNSIGSFSAGSLHSILVSRIRSDLFSNRINRLRDSKWFQQSSSIGAFSDDPKSHPLLDSSFIRLFRENYDTILRVASRVPPEPKLGSPVAEQSGNGAVAAFPGETGAAVPRYNVHADEPFMARQKDEEIAKLTMRIAELEIELQMKDEDLALLQDRNTQLESDRAKADSPNGPSSSSLQNSLLSDLGVSEGLIKEVFRVDRPPESAATTRFIKVLQENERLQSLAHSYSSQLEKLEREHEELLKMLDKYEGEMRARKQGLTAEPSDDREKTSPIDKLFQDAAAFAPDERTALAFESLPLKAHELTMSDLPAATPHEQASVASEVMPCDFFGDGPELFSTLPPPTTASAIVPPNTSQVDEPSLLSHSLLQDSYFV